MPAPKWADRDGTLKAWRLIVEKIASLRDLETEWSIDDVADANDMLEMLAAQQKARAPA